MSRSYLQSKSLICLAFNVVGCVGRIVCDALAHKTNMPNLSKQQTFTAEPGQKPNFKWRKFSNILNVQIKAHVKGTTLGRLIADHIISENVEARPLSNSPDLRTAHQFTATLLHI